MYSCIYYSMGNKNELLVYQAKNGAIELTADYNEDTIWASASDISSLFGINKSNTSRHIHSIFQDEEIIKNSTVAKYATVEKKKVKE